MSNAETCVTAGKHRPAEEKTGQVAALVRETGIDRSSFFKFLKGSSEIPAEAAVIPLLNHGSRIYIIKKTGNCSLSLFLPWRFQNVPSHIQTYYLLKYR